MWQAEAPYRVTLHEKRLTNDGAWTVPIALNVSVEPVHQLNQDVGLWSAG
jgi:ATP sulfurylase